MATTLEQLLDDIHPRRTVDETARRANGAIDRFSVPMAFEDMDSFLAHMRDFVRVCTQDMLRMSGDFPEGFQNVEDGLCLDLLKDAFGPHGFRIAFDMACTGAEGGLYRVLTDIAKTMAGHCTKNEIAAKVNCYWNDLTVEEKLAAPDEYLEKHGNVLPSGYEWNIRANFRDFLLKHPMLVQQWERIGRD
jgi:hypothetical protein